MGSLKLHIDTKPTLSVTYRKKAQKLSKNTGSYYSFGLQHKGYNDVISANVNSMANKFAYNGKENNPELGLEFMDFGARNYEASLGRWINLDPLSAKYQQYSPYSYTLNNPIYFVDPDGREVVAQDEETQNLILGFISKQLGENHGFSFNKKGKLNHKGSKSHRQAKKGYSDEQKKKPF